MGQPIKGGGSDTGWQYKFSRHYVSKPVLGIGGLFWRLCHLEAFTFRVLSKSTQANASEALVQLVLFPCRDPGQLLKLLLH
jgi:hypothetical protein